MTDTYAPALPTGCYSLVTENASAIAAFKLVLRNMTVPPPIQVVVAT